MDVSRLDCMGWHASIALEDGIAGTYRWFLDNRDGFRG
jgi:GDP-L-fucose synthase